MKNDFLVCRSDSMYCGQERVLLRGFGLGGWLLPEGYMWQMEGKYDRPRRMEQLIETLCGSEYAASFWARYENSYLTKRDIEWIASLGFNSVRLPINARRLFRFSSGKAAFVPETLDCIDRLIDWCRTYQIYVILDMHAAPGGQTGQNIDDSEQDQPELFLVPDDQENLCAAWELLAQRYENETVVAAYDLLNEPLPDFFGQYNDRVLPLYRRLIARIRAIDPNHMIMLEGAHWATDFSILDDMTKEEAADNIALQFHRYWSAPDEESLDRYVAAAKRLDVPLYLGESGENNLDWYTTMFPLCGRLNIGWSFWSYKKMDCDNSPVTFSRPAGWDRLMDYIKNGAKIEQAEAQSIFNEFLACVETPIYNTRVVGALTRTPPFALPCEAFDKSHIVNERIDGAILRMREQASLLFRDGHAGEPDYRRLKGEPQPESETVVVRLRAGDAIEFFVHIPTVPCFATIWAYGKGDFVVSSNGVPISCKRVEDETFEFTLRETGDIALSIHCIQGQIDADRIEFR
ncbi:MAG: cellulase family glycosylhydrolase [Eubacteriales bacterium]|nr:cellulase family glycosylhydrolase [Eubacteriales bacterium]